jgi:hypothetical protein
MKDYQGESRLGRGTGASSSAVSPYQTSTGPWPLIWDFGGGVGVEGGEGRGVVVETRNFIRKTMGIKLLSTWILLIQLIQVRQIILVYQYFHELLCVNGMFGYLLEEVQKKHESNRSRHP